MDKKTFVVASFQGGMFETVKQDMPNESQNGVTQSVAWLENYVHTSLQGALIKRNGWRFVLTYNPSFGTEFIDRPHPPGIKTNVTYDQDNTDQLGFATGTFCDFWTTYDSVNEQNQVLGLTFTKSSRTLYSETVPIVFMRFYSEITEDWIEALQNGTMIVACLAEKGHASPQWRSPFVNGYGITEHPYPGWLPRGLLTDYTHYGGTIILTTALNIDDVVPFDTENYRTTVDIPTTTPDVSTNMYPCYVWGWWSIESKRDRGYRDYWNIVELAAHGGAIPLEDLIPMYNADNLYGTHKVRYPSTWLLRNDCVRIVEVDSPSEILSTTMTHDVEVCIGEMCVRPIDTNFNSWYTADNADKDPLANPLDYPYVSTIFGSYFNKDLAYSESLEVLTGIDYIRNDKQWSYVEVAEPGVKSARSFEERTLSATYANKEWYLQAIGSPMSVLWYEWNGTRFSHIMFAPNEDRHPNWNHRGYMILGTRLPNYLENGNPRPWMKGEKIPLVVTAVVNGTEVKLLDYVYEVKTEHYDPNPNLFNIAANHTLRWYSIGGPLIEQGGFPEDSALWHYEAWNDFLESEPWRPSSLSRMFYGAYDAGILIDGKQAFCLPVIAAPVKRSVAVAPYETYDKGLPDYIGYCWEPFNPSQQPPYTQDLTDPLYDSSYYINHGVTGNSIGFRPKLTQPNYLYLNLRIKNDSVAKLVSLNVEKINVYIAKASQTKSRFKSIGLFSISKNVPATYYGLPEKEYWDDNPQDYGLLRSFVFDGRTNGFADVDNFDEWKEFYRGDPVDINSWGSMPDRIISWPMNADGDPYNSSVFPFLGVFPMTPDFFIWDYATGAPTLSLNSDGTYWHGRSARCVEQIKGRVFLGGTIDEQGEEEEGMVRYSAVQGANISLDVFNKSDFLKFGALPIVAMKEYREQLWVFNRHEVYRLQMPSVTQPVTWEVLEKTSGQGSYNPKTVVSTPYGVVWCNDNGVWISDGRIPENLAQAIVPAYQWLAIMRPHPLMRINKIKPVPIEDGYNRYLSMVYDPVKDTLVISTPFVDLIEGEDLPTRTPDSDVFLQDHEFKGEFALIFDFASKTWRAESAEFPMFGNAVSRETILWEIS